MADAWDDDDDEEQDEKENLKGSDTDVTLGLKGEMKNDAAIPWHINPTDVTLGVELGKGVFGAVYRGKLYGQDVAIKKLFVSGAPDQEIADFKKEVAIMHNLRHPNVVLFMGASFESNNLLLVTELMQGSVEDWLHGGTRKPPTFVEAISIAKQCAKGMNWLHSLTPPFLHLDLKPANLLVDRHGTVKLADFGLSVMRKRAAEGEEKQKSTGAVGSPLYMAPEMLCQKDFDEKVDVYAFAIMLWEFVTAKEPYEGRFGTLKELAQGVVLKKIRPVIPPNVFPPGLEEMVGKCWHTYARHRLSFGEILASGELDKAVVQRSVKDADAAAFWSDKFLADEGEVAWHNFLKGFIGYFDAGDIVAEHQELAMKCVFTEGKGKEKEIVRIEQFATVCQYFGPCGKVLVENVCDIVPQDWFHGQLDTNGTDTALKGKSPGTFLVRFSSTPGCFTVSMKKQNRSIKHFRITRNGAKFVINKKNYTSLSAALLENGKAMLLKMPCPGAPYASLFASAGSAYAQDNYYGAVDD
eukprot:TRINITY_DN1598_c0_g2_i1.p1 TRINITY_DN1598_c0_g2~~TRINITY_DN1598_c0_g2_i1.p1  ORF type:complete len:524 (-),score=116.01 TRINITY_DN1598_c0_g2_i1:102-1673(-)